jgi:hypothetical protein
MFAYIEIWDMVKLNDELDLNFKDEFCKGLKLFDYFWTYFFFLVTFSNLVRIFFHQCFSRRWKSEAITCSTSFLNSNF